MCQPAATRRFTAAAVPGNRNRAGRYRIVLFNTLVFGSASSPTIWGRMARLGRTARGSGGERLGPMSKATGGKDIEWVGARITCQDAEKAVVVTLPPAKVQALLHDTEKFLKKPVVGARELLAAFWAALSRHDVTNEGHPLKRARHLIHVKRVSPALRWVRALLSGGATSERIFYAAPPRTDLEILTDASPWGDGCCETPGWKTHRVLLYAHPRLRPLQVQSSEREAENTTPSGKAWPSWPHSGCGFRAWPMDPLSGRGRTTLVSSRRSPKAAREPQISMCWPGTLTTKRPAPTRSTRAHPGSHEHPGRCLVPAICSGGEKLPGGAAGRTSI